MMPTSQTGLKAYQFIMLLSQNNKPGGFLNRHLLSEVLELPGHNQGVGRLAPLENPVQTSLPASVVSGIFGIAGLIERHPHLCSIPRDNLPLCVSISTCPPLTRTPVLLGEGPTLPQDDVILTISICNSPISK